MENIALGNFKHDIERFLWKFHRLHFYNIDTLRTKLEGRWFWIQGVGGNLWNDRTLIYSSSPL